jgi:hypothetical protein
MVSIGDGRRAQFLFLTGELIFSPIFIQIMSQVCIFFSSTRAMFSYSESVCEPTAHRLKSVCNAAAGCLGFFHRRAPPAFFSYACCSLAQRTWPAPNRIAMLCFAKPIHSITTPPTRPAEEQHRTRSIKQQQRKTTDHTPALVT